MAAQYFASPYSQSYLFRGMRLFVLFAFSHSAQCAYLRPPPILLVVFLTRESIHGAHIKTRSLFPAIYPVVNFQPAAIDGGQSRSQERTTPRPKPKTETETKKQNKLCGNPEIPNDYSMHLYRQNPQFSKQTTNVLSVLGTMKP